MKLVQRLKDGERCGIGLFVRDTRRFGKCYGIMLPLWPVYGEWYDMPWDSVRKGWRLMLFSAWVNDGWRIGCVDIRLSWGGKPIGKQKLIKGYAY